ncbi:MAG: accessory factor UbiK family protein [Legionellaceae bacterium]|nr:accessory factor UbiK family protein [Legionellaceae bacterium]
MFNTEQLDSLAQKLCAALPTGLGQIESEVRDSFKSILQAGLAQLDLVTREEFDAQVKVLARTREKVDILEQQLTTFLSEKKN